MSSMEKQPPSPEHTHRVCDMGCVCVREVGVCKRRGVCVCGEGVLELVGWLAGWLAGWLVGWLAGWLVGCAHVRLLSSCE